jgi:hypothetical protein
LTLLPIFEPIAQSLPHNLDSSSVLSGNDPGLLNENKTARESSALDVATQEGISNLDLAPWNVQDLDYNISLFSSEIFTWSPFISTAPSPNNTDLYYAPLSPIQPESPQVASATSDAPCDEQLTEHLSLLRKCFESGHKKAGHAIFMDLMKAIFSRIPNEIAAHITEVFKHEALKFEVAEAKFDALIAERRQKYGNDHLATIQMSISLADFILQTLELDVDQDDLETGVVNYKFERARSLLEGVLRIGFNDRVVEWSLKGGKLEQEETVEEDELSELALMEIYIVECSKQPFLIEAVTKSARYCEVYRSHKIRKTLDESIWMGHVNRDRVSKF